MRPCASHLTGLERKNTKTRLLHNSQEKTRIAQLVSSRCWVRYGEIFGGLRALPTHLESRMPWLSWLAFRGVSLGQVQIAMKCGAATKGRGPVLIERYKSNSISYIYIYSIYHLSIFWLFKTLLFLVHLAEFLDGRNPNSESELCPFETSCESACRSPRPLPVTCFSRVQWNCHRYPLASEPLVIHYNNLL